MFLRFSQTRLFILLLLFLSLFALTACNRKDDGVSPPQTMINPTDVLGQFLVNPENATFSLDLIPLKKDPTALFQKRFQSNTASVTARISIPKASIAPNPNGTNLALSAEADASSCWPWPLYGYPFTPSRANNGIANDCWASHFGEGPGWYSLDWASAVTISRIYITYQPFAPNFGQTVSSIKCFVASTSSWVTIPGSNFTLGASRPAFYDFTFDPIKTTGIIVYLKPGPEARHPNACVFISELEVYGASVTPKISKIEFSGTALNKIFDRKNHQLLGPPHWAATVQSGQVAETKNSSFSYVINNQLSLKPDFVSEDGTPLPAGSNFDIELTGKVKDLIGAEPDRTITFPPQNWSGSQIEMVSNEALHTKVGIWGLELNWVFKKNGSQIGDQRTPKASTYHCAFTTWGKPKDDGNFSVKAPTIGGFWYAEELPTSYLEIFNISCSYAKGFSAGASEETITAQIYDRLWSDNVYSFNKKDSDYQRRGIDRILVEKNGWCGELANLLHALVEIQGINVKTRGYNIKKEFLMWDVCWLVSDIESLPAAGQILPKYILPPKENRWVFYDHCAVILESSGTVFNPTFHQKNISFDAYVNDLFDVGYLSFPVSETSHWNIKSKNPSPTYIDIKDYQ